MKFQEVVAKVKELKLPERQYAIFGSGPIVVRGIREFTHDADIIVTQEVWDAYKNRSGWVMKPCNQDYYLELEGENIELWNRWRPGKWDIEKLIHEADMIGGLPYVRLKEVLAWKKLNAREKDLKDVRLIKEYLAK